jgi:hypothetical protein
MKLEDQRGENTFVIDRDKFGCLTSIAAELQRNVKGTHINCRLLRAKRAITRFGASPCSGPVSSKIRQTLHLFASKHLPAKERRVGTNRRLGQIKPNFSMQTGGNRYLLCFCYFSLNTSQNVQMDRTSKGLTISYSTNSIINVHIKQM